jgi:Glycosyltransferase family 87
MQLVRKLILASALVTALLLVLLPGSALASSGGSSQASSSYGLALPLVAPSSVTVPPPGFSSSADQAVKASELNRTMLALHAREHPLQFQALVWEGQSWFVNFSYRGKLVAEVVETRAARITHVWTGPLASAVYARGDFATLFGSAWVLVPFSLLFVLPFLDLRRRWRMLHLDALVLLSFLISYLLFDHAKLVAAVWMVYPPTLYLLARMLWIGGLRIRRRRGTTSRGTGRPIPRGLSPLLSVRVLAVGLVALVGARVALSLASSTVVDVGYASVIGAHRIAAGQPLYYASAAHGDTYGPIAYLAYLPFELLFPWHGAWNYLPSAHAASIVFDLVTVGGLVTLGRRLRGGREGWRLGLALGWAWSACPFTLLALMMHTNDGLVAMLSVLSLLAFASPAARGALLGLAAAAKFAPAALLGLYAGQRDRGIKGAVACVASFAVVVVTAIGLYLPSGGLTEFYNHTIGYQLTRSDVFSAWALHPSLDPLKLVIEVGAVVLAAAVAFFPRRRSVVEICALAGAITIALQLPAVHWFYYFIVWFVPFVLVALLAGGEEATGDEVNSARPAATAAPAPDLVPAVV